jgi:hypothetical protein
MIAQLRKNIVHKLWETYRNTSPDMLRIEAALQQRGIRSPVLDHFAIIDLPGPHTGIPYLSQIFSILGYEERGKDYLADKQNDFLWMAESNIGTLPAASALPQVVVADFRLDAMPVEIKKIIEKYSKQSQISALAHVQKLAQRASSGDTDAARQCADTIMHYLRGRDWPLPTSAEFHRVREFNELLAWVLIFGRRPNHFTLSIHLLDHFTDLADFHRFIEEEVQLPLNSEGGAIKGGAAAGMAQGSTAGISQTVKLADGTIDLPTGFVEFVWRYPGSPDCQQPLRWDDYFTGFIAHHADRVIESLYTDPLHFAS